MSHAAGFNPFGTTIFLWADSRFLDICVNSPNLQKRIHWFFVNKTENILETVCEIEDHKNSSIAHLNSKYLFHSNEKNYTEKCKTYHE